MNMSTTPIPTTGYFVDWNGEARRVEAPGRGYTCVVIKKDGYLGVDVIDGEDFVTHEATYFESLEAIAATGCTVKLHEDAGATESSRIKRGM